MATARAGSTSGPKRKPVRPRRAHIVKDDAGKPVVVVLPIAEYEALVERIQDLEDVLAAEQARREGGDDMPFEQFEAELQARPDSR